MRRTALMIAGAVLLAHVMTAGADPGTFGQWCGANECGYGYPATAPEYAAALHDDLAHLR